MKASPKLFAKLGSLAALAIMLLGIALEAIQPAPVFADDTVYANAVSCDSGTCNPTAGAIDTNDTTFGTFTKASGAGTSLQMTFTFGSTLTPVTGTQVTVLYKFVKGSQDPWCTLRWNSSNGGTYNAGVTLTNSGTYASSFLLSTSANLYSVLVTCSGNSSAQTDNIYYIKASYLAPTATPTGTATATNTGTATATSTGTQTPTITNTPLPTATHLAGSFEQLGNYIRDGGMEQYPISDYWSLIDSSLNFGRFSDAGNWWFQDKGAACGTGYQVIGTTQIGFFGWGGDVISGGIQQNFAWPGGNMILEFQHRASFSPIGPAPRLLVVVTNRSNGLRYTFGDGADDFVTSTALWTQTIPASQTIPAGNYKLTIDDYGQHDGFNQTFFVDDVVVALDSNNIIVVGGCTSGTDPNQVTPAPTSFALNSNCDFESGSVNWHLSDGSFIDSDEPVGPVGNRYLMASQPFGSTSITSSEDIDWPGGYMYLTAYIRSDTETSANITVGRVNGSLTSLYQVLISTGIGPYWKQYFGFVNMAAGTYRIIFDHSQTGIAYDGVSWSGNTYVDCVGASTTTPTVTFTPSRTPTGTLPTSTRTGTATSTLIPSRTPTNWITNTPRTPTYPTQPPFTSTSPATSTAVPTNTQSGPNKTATAQGTNVGTFTPYPTYTSQATYTPYPGTGGSGGSGGIVLPPDPPQQPPAGSGAECVPPLMGGIDVAGWAAYQQCQALNYISWSPTNTAQIKAWPTLASGREPFSTINQTGNFFRSLTVGLNAVDWSTTGANCSVAPDPKAFVKQAQGILLGQLTFSSTTYAFNLTCKTAAADIVGPIITKGLCLAMNLLCLIGLLQTFQMICNAGVVALLVLYIKSAWIDRSIS